MPIFARAGASAFRRYVGCARRRRPELGDARATWCLSSEQMRWMRRLPGQVSAPFKSPFGWHIVLRS